MNGEQLPGGADERELLTGRCADRGSPRVAPDLEAEAQAIDHELSLHYGRVVDRWDWAAGAPDGILDNVLSWLPSTRRRREIWQHGQRLWAERMDPDRRQECATRTGLSASSDA